MSDPEFPVLGTEPVAVELANTLYDGTDYLRTAAWVDAWFALVRPAETAAMGRVAADVRALRDSVHHLLTAAVEGRTPDAAAVERVNAFAAAAPTHLRLDWSAGGPAAHWADTTDGSTATLGRIATCCIELLTGPRAGGVRRCQSPDCSLIFVQSHPRRRWCHPSCAHRDRQARYYRRHHSTGASS
ncbi:CGNR zinc finger domain-containing protein [Nonomuraea rhizosphaerae]|uniref:CGNR zinc finger domain-containing protein n=1 Tax=Nonomuraea rhizosphaerae TaxID=2665663 RepID=UPI001C5FF526|nr:ABATE domain-containing protein [Nonomuraea rhizosphaerae]